MVKINTVGKSGYIAKNVLVRSNDPERPGVNITMEGFIQYNGKGKNGAINIRAKGAGQKGQAGSPNR